MARRTLEQVEGARGKGDTAEACGVLIIRSPNTHAPMEKDLEAMKKLGFVPLRLQAN